MKLIGNIDIVSNQEIIGWVANVDNFEESLMLDVSVNGALVTSITANQMRNDIKDANIGTGGYGFCIDLKKWIDFPGNYEISIITNREKKAIPNTPVNVSIQGEYVQNSKDLMLEQQVLSAGYFMNITSPHKIDRATLFKKINSSIDSGQPVIVLPPFIDWNIALFQRPQHIARALAKQGALVIYSTGGYYDTSDGYYELEKNLIWTNRFNEIEDSLSGVWFELYSTNPFPTLEKLAKWKANGNKLLYEYVDHIDEAISGGYTNSLVEVFNGINIELIDLFVATAKNLYEELLDRFGDSRLVLAPNGVDVAHFTKKVEMAFSMQKIVDMKKPIVGYFGALAPWIDYELIAEIAVLRPEVNFVYIGPEYNLKTKLPIASNIFWLGKVDYTELPSYGQHFDVCFIPFKTGRIAETTSPLKLFEYFALQKPVVVTSSMRECVAFKDVFHGNTAIEVVHAFDLAFESAKKAKSKQKWLCLANENSWQNRATTMFESMKNASTEIIKSGTNLKLNTGVSVASGNFKEPFKMVPVYFAPDNKSGALKFGLATNHIQGGDYVTIEIPVCEDIFYSASFTIQLPDCNFKNHMKYQIFCNEQIVFESDLCSVTKTFVTIFSSSPLKKLEVRNVYLCDVNSSWLAGEIWRIVIEELVLGIEKIPTPFFTVETSDPNAKVIRKPSQQLSF